MNAVEKTQQLERVFLPIMDLEPNEDNPNEMSEAEFNMLADNIEKVGLVDPIFVRRKKPEEITPERPANHRIVGGYHRWEVAKLYEFTEVPCTVVTDPEFDSEQEAFQTVRMNIIRGRMSPDKFVNMYSKLSTKYSDQILQESFGFVSEEEFQKMIRALKKDLPSELQAEFQKASKELKTIGDLSKLLNKLFSTYGDTLPYGYMLIDFGGKESIWLRMSGETKKQLFELLTLCRKEKRTVDDLIGGLIQMAGRGELSSQLLQLIAKSPEVELPAHVEIPSYEAAAAAGVTTN